MCFSNHHMIIGAYMIQKLIYVNVSSLGSTYGEPIYYVPRLKCMLISMYGYFILMLGIVEIHEIEGY